MFGIDDAALVLAASGIASTAGALYTNKKNLEYQQNVNDTNWQIAAQNNATQIDMANTAHQREVADLRAAGLNPVLSSGGSGASTPSLTSMRGDSAQIENPAEGIANSAKSLASYVSQSYKTQLDQAKADVKSTEVDTTAQELQNSVNKLNARKADLELRAIDDLMTTSELSFDKKTGRYHVNVNGDDSNSDYFKALEKGVLNNAEVGQYMPYLDAGGKVINSAGNLRNLFRKTQSLRRK